jgi:hypothetical protein
MTPLKTNRELDQATAKAVERLKADILRKLNLVLWVVIAVDAIILTGVYFIITHVHLTAP